MKNKKLEVRDLRVSFRTSNGKVQAVRGIDFDLYEGETLAIVGESGSGKSVTSRAVMGILAPNAILESGEVLYEGKDLLKFRETEFRQIRGDKIAMIFQDPLSSLNPIVKIGKQLTEAMILKNRTSRRRCRKDFDAILKQLSVNVDDKAFDTLISNFRKAYLEQARLEKQYDVALEAVYDTLSKIESLLNSFEKKDKKLIATQSVRIAKGFKRTLHKDLVDLPDGGASLSAPLFQEVVTRESLERLADILREASQKSKPDFQARGCYLTFSGSKELIDESQMREYTENLIMREFRQKTLQAVTISREKCVEAKKLALEQLKKGLEYFGKRDIEKKETALIVKSLIAAVEAGIDKLDIRIDNDEHTFGTSLKSFAEIYFSSVNKNKKEQARYQKQVAKCEKAEKKGHPLDWKPVPAAVVDRALVLENIRRLLGRRIESTQNNLQEGYDCKQASERVIEFSERSASGAVDKVSFARAKRKAIKLMEEVGIPDPEKRFDQYPFQMSGGQRQRIVIAIALSADPDILICDEPTTALDVTIQAQTLELINRIKAERNLSVIFITHDLGVVANMADRVAIMYAGKIVEYGGVEEIFYEPAHPYTWALLSSVPDLESKDKLEAIPGTPPNMIYPPKGDAFAERNRYALKIDFEQQPPMFRITDTHFAATWLLHPYSPKVEMPKAITDRIKRMKAQNATSEEATTDLVQDEEAVETPNTQEQGDRETVETMSQEEQAKPKPTKKTATPKSTTKTTTAKKSTAKTTTAKTTTAKTTTKAATAKKPTTKTATTKPTTAEKPTAEKKAEDKK